MKYFKNKPIDSVKISCFFGDDPDIYRRYSLKGHNGIDFRLRNDYYLNGYENIMSVDDGIIIKIKIKNRNEYGSYIKIKHHDGSCTIYGHYLLPVVRLGEEVTPGQVIGLYNHINTDNQYHLHFSYYPPRVNKNNGYKGATDPLSMFTNIL